MLLNPKIPLPVVAQANDVARFFQLREKLAYCPRLAGQDPFGLDIGERLKHKFPLMHSRVWQLQSLVVDSAVPAVKQIDVDGA